MLLEGASQTLPSITLADCHRQFFPIFEDKCTTAPSFFFFLKKKQINTNFWNRKKIMLEVNVARGYKHYLIKSAHRKEQISKAFVSLRELVCALRSADFLRKCLSPRTMRTISFSISSIIFSKSSRICFRRCSNLPPSNSVADEAAPCPFCASRAATPASRHSSWTIHFSSSA